MNAHRMLSWIWILWVSVCVFFLWIGEAAAFGPITHINLGSQILAGAGLLGAGLQKLLRDHAHEFLYGNMAADVILGKNLAPQERHCHNWSIGFSVLNEAKTAGQEAFAWGYLSHLAADVIAHNYFVPWKLVESYPSRTTGHAYWEIRLDQKAESSVWSLASEVSRKPFQEQKALLSRTIEGTLFNFETNLIIFNGILFVQRMKRWKGLLDRLDRRSPWALSSYDAEVLWQMGVDSIRDLLVHQRESLSCKADPTGIPNLLQAKDLRRAIRRMQQIAPLPRTRLEPLLFSLKDGFAKSIYGAFQMPPLPTILSDLLRLPTNDPDEDRLVLDPMSEERP